MPDETFQPTTDPADLEEVELRPRSKRDAVVSVRLSPSEVSALSELATRAGMSLSEFTRTILRGAIATQWRVHVWQQGGLITHPQETGGEFTRMFESPGAAHGRVEWRTRSDPFTKVG